MAVYLFTFHAYRSWSADNPRGFVRQGQGMLPPSREMAEQYDRNAAEAPIRFDAFHQRVLVWIAYDACARRPWRLHYVATDPTHVHIVVSWQEYQPWAEVRDRLKNLASLLLGQKCCRPGRSWLSRKGSRKRVRNRKHFDYLVGQYLPRH